MADLLLDTDVFVDHLRGAHRLPVEGHVVHYSVVTRAELFAGRETDEDRVGLLLAPFRELPVDRAVAERAGRLRRATAIGMADALVAATALENGLRLVTLRGASRAEQGLSFGREAALARKLATDKGMQIGLDGVQLLGGHGFTKEHPVERWYRDLRAVGVAEGIVLI